MRPTPAPAEQAALRELAAVVDGPHAGRWYWHDDLEAMQTASRRMGHADEHLAAVFRLYQPTDEWVQHPTATGVQGRGWRYQQRAAAPRRVLVTGSRDRTDTTAIRTALAAQWGDGTGVLVSGGWDRLAEACWTTHWGRTHRDRRHPHTATPPPITAAGPA